MIKPHIIHTFIKIKNYLKYLTLQKNKHNLINNYSLILTFYNLHLTNVCKSQEKQAGKAKKAKVCDKQQELVPSKV